jgi:outer membrane cobalamin receptor
MLVALSAPSLLLLLGCSQAMKETPEKERNVITTEEIQAAQASTAYDVIAKLRGNFLRSRGQNSILLKQPKEPTVYLDEVEYGTIASLRQIPASTIAEIRFIEGNDAMRKYGSNHVSGVIQIYTRYQ